MIAFCWRTGVIGFGQRVPRGAIEIMRGSARTVRETMCATARHARKSDALLVPGIPEAADDDEAALALRSFIDWINGRLKPETRVRLKIGRLSVTTEVTR